MSYKIALASSDGQTIDLHFGEITKVSVYEVKEEDGSFSFIEDRKIEYTPDPDAQSCEGGCSCGKGFSEKVAQSVKDCTYFLVAKIGNRPSRMLQENNVNCIEAPYSISQAIEKLNRYYVLHKKREEHVF